MADNGKIDVDGLPARPAGNLDSIVGVDKATRQAAQFPVTALPMPQGVVSAIQQQNATIEAIRASQGSGLPSYATRAALPAPGTLPRPAGGGDPLVTVTNDPTAANNGAWRDTGSAWVQSADRVSVLTSKVDVLDQSVGAVGAELLVGSQPGFVQGGLLPANGLPATGTTRLRSDFVVAQAASVVCAPTQQVGVFLYEADGTYRGWTDWKSEIPILDISGQFRVLVRNTDDSELVVEDNTAAVKVGRVTQIEDRIAAGESLAQTVQSRLSQMPVPVFEQPMGYPARPAVPMVTWLGPNEPPIQSSADEWRPTAGGYLYMAPIERYPLGTVPAEWDRRWVIQDAWSVVQTSVGRSLFVTPTARVRQLLAYQPVDPDPSPDMEIVCRLMMPIADPLGFYAGLRFSGEEGSETGYAIAPSTPGNIRLYRYVEGAAYQTGGDFPSGTVVSGEWFWVRMRAQGSLIRAKLWSDDDREPTSWHLEITNGSVSGSGAVGIIPAVRRIYCSYFAAASGSETAPGGT